LSTQGKAYVAGLCAVLAWSTVATAFKLSLRYLHPATLVLYASAFSLMVLLGILALQRRLGELPAALKQHWLRALLLGAINPFLYYLVLFKAYDLLRAQEAQAINYTWALTMTLLAIPLLKQRLKWQDALAALVCYLGVVVIASHGALFSLHYTSPKGIGLALLSTLLWAVYWLMNTKDPREPIIGLTLNFALSMPLALIWSACTGTLQMVPWQGMAGAAYIGTFEMGVTFVLWLQAMRLTEHTARIANLIFLSPLLSLTLIHLILKEPVPAATTIGLSLILGGLLLQKVPDHRWRQLQRHR
jgi:drug/metabolite transporter (DMT)-like permease